MLRVIALESDVTVSASYIEGFLVLEMVFILSYKYGSGSSHVEDTDLAALREIVCAEDFGSFEGEVLLYRNCASGDNTVEDGINHVDFIGNHNVLHEVFLAQTRCIIMLCIHVAGCLSYCAIDFGHVLELFGLFSDICKDTAVNIEDMAVDCV